MKRILFLWAVLLPALSTSAWAQMAPDDMKDKTFGPYLQNAMPTSIVVCWRTRKSGTGRVRYGTTTAYGATIQDLSKDKLHQLRLPNLTPNTLYYYEAKSVRKGATIFLKTGSFRTAVTGSTPFTFIHMGETHNKDVIRDFREEILAASPHLILDASDQVDVGRKLKLWDRYFTIGREFYPHVPLFTAVGNHTYYAFLSGKIDLILTFGLFKSTKTYRKLMNLPGNEEWYAVRYGNTQFIVLNSTIEYDRKRLSIDQVQWLQATLQQATDGVNDPVFKVVMYHVPTYSSGPSKREGERKLTRQLFVPLFEQYGVDLVLMAHDKFTERSVKNGINYVQIASGKVDPQIQTNNPYDVFQDTTHHAIMICSVQTGAIQCSIVTETGQILHQFTVTP